MNLKELYIKYKNEYPNEKIGFSKFAELRPKWWVLAESSSTHTVCVCVVRQNMKLMLNESKLNIVLPDLLETIVCRITNEKCMLNFCQHCPGFEFLRIMFNNDDIQYTKYDHFKQWVDIDRTALITKFTYSEFFHFSITKSYDEFFEYFSEQLIKLKPHHFIAKQQSSYLRAKKESLLETECIVLRDFAENYTFVVQDEIQSYHRVNLQATLHPYTIYYKSTMSNVLKTKSFCITSDHLKHNADSVFSFQSRLLQQIKNKFLNIFTIHYYTLLYTTA